MTVEISGRARTLILALIDHSMEAALARGHEFAAAIRRRDVAQQHLTEYVAQLEACGDQAITKQLNLAAAERILIEHAMQITKGNRSRAAQLLGINVRTLRRRLNGDKR